MSELFISRVFEEHVAPRRGATWPPRKQQDSGSGGTSTSGGCSSSGGGSSGGACASPAKRGAASSLPSIPGTSPPRSPASRAARQQQHGSSGNSASIWPPPLPPNAAGPRDEMDLLAFADFVLAWDHRNQAAAIPYFFKIFDIHHRVRARVVGELGAAVKGILAWPPWTQPSAGCAHPCTRHLLSPPTAPHLPHTHAPAHPPTHQQGYLTVSDLYTFFREIHALWIAMGEYAELEVADVLDEVMDMVQPAAPGRITRADLEACKMSGTVFGMLANVDQFYAYNFRENMMQEGGGGGEGGGQ
jgi:hypothetical protein